MTYEIIVQDLCKSFDGKTVLNNVNLEVAQGTSFVIIGGSGSGKSVLLKSMIGLLIPDAGSKVIFGGVDYSLIPINQRSKFLTKFGMLFQGGALFDSLTIWENICFAVMKSGSMNGNEAYEYAIELLNNVGLRPDVAKLYPPELSGGMQKRAALARAIATKPSVIFFDEPTAGLDPIMSSVISTLIADLSKKLGATTITITHDMRCVEIIANQVAMIHQGTIAWQGDKLELFKTKDKVVNNFVNGSTD